MTTPQPVGSTLAEARARLVDAMSRLAQAEAVHDASSGHERAETYMEVQHWSGQVEEARAAWRALAGSDAPAP